MKELIISLLGEYQTKTDAAGNLIGGLAGLDYEWIIGALCFAVASYIVLRTISAMLIAVFKGGN